MGGPVSARHDAAHGSARVAIIKTESVPEFVRGYRRHGVGNTDTCADGYERLDYGAGGSSSINIGCRLRSLPYDHSQSRHAIHRVAVGNVLISRFAEVNPGTVILHATCIVPVPEPLPYGVPHSLAEISIDDDVHLGISRLGGKAREKEGLSQGGSWALAVLSPGISTQTLAMTRRMSARNLPAGVATLITPFLRLAELRDGVPHRVQKIV